jgi:hypothetical protein
MQIPLLSGVVSGPEAEFIARYPLNLEPVPVDLKMLGQGQLRAGAGTIDFATGQGFDRGSILWNGTQYRVSGSKLVSVSPSGVVTVIGDVGNDGRRAGLDYSFDRLIIRSAGSLYYFDGTDLIQVTDEDLGVCVDAIWIDGYTMSTDGTSVVVTELNDPTEVKPLKYGSAENDPDPITGLIRYREEAYVLGRNTIQTFKNVGGNGFPFQTLQGGTIPFGCVSANAKCLWGDGFAFVGSGRDEALNVYAGGQGTATAFGNKALCDALAAVEDTTAIEIEGRTYGGEQRLFVHLPDESWCFLVNASRIFGQPVWYRLQSNGPYRLRNAVEVNGRLYVGDSASAKIGELTDRDPRHWGEDVDWGFDAGLVYNQGQGAIIHSAELIGLPGRGSGDGAIFLSISRDGETFGTERSIRIKPGDRTKRLQWRPHARLGVYLGFRFRGVGAMLPGIAALEVTAQSLGAQ